MDLLLTQNFDVTLDDRNDLAMVEGREAIEQSIAMATTQFFYEEIGSISKTNAVNNIELYVKHLVDANDDLVGIIEVSADIIEDHIEVFIQYEGGENVSFPIGN